VHPELAVVARRQGGLFRRVQALARHDRGDVERRVRRGEWVVVRHGVLATATVLERAAEDPRALHLLHAAARLLVTSGDVVVSHESAAVYHRLALLGPMPAQPQLTRHRDATAGRITAHGLYVAAVPTLHRVGVGVGVGAGTMSSAARTVADCARALDGHGAFVAAESALRLGLDRSQVLEVLAYCAGWPGVVQARELVELADASSESALESRARLWFADRGLPPPQQQRVVRTVDGRFVARVDFVWEEHRTVCETDGRLKYAELGSDDRAVAGMPLWDEKLREDRLRDLGLEVVRGYWSDGDDDGARLAERLRRAFARGARAAGPPVYRLWAPGPPMHQPLATTG
jgi:hypothetical protein